jgi:hypothetical protein
MNIFRTVLSLGLVAGAVIGSAQTFSLTAPTEDAFVGRSTPFSFNITGAKQQVTIKLVANGPNGFKTTNDKKFTPNVDGKIEGSITLSLSQTSPEGVYNCELTATEPGKTYPKLTRRITVDGTAPKFLDFNPVDGIFTKGNVRITADLLEANVEEWRVTVNNDDIPNNTGDSKRVDVVWDSSAVELDGSQSVKINVKDKAENESNQTVSVTIDRVKPVSSIISPRAVDGVSRKSNFNIIIDIADASQTSVDVSGIDVTLTTVDNKYITRVPRISFEANGNVHRFSGRVRKELKLPKEFKIVVRAVDRAGNVGIVQSVKIRVKG